MGKNHKKIVLLILACIFFIWLLLIGVIVFLLWNDTRDPYNNAISSEKIPRFTQMRIDKWHSFSGEVSLPMRWSTLIDINNDWVDEIFLWGWAWQEDQIYQYWWDEFIDISSQFRLSKEVNENTLAASSVDLDNNGFSDLIVSRDNWVFAYFNLWKWFIKRRINTWMNNRTSPLWLTFWDIDKDGDLDIFVAWYIKKDQMNGLTNFSAWYGGMSALLLNNGDKSFSNINALAWLEYTHNTFQWIFVDLNNDSWLDLVVAYDTWEPRIYKNNGDLSFSFQKNPYTDKFSYPMWIAVGDYDNDGDSDIFFSNIGSSLPKFMVKWDLETTRDLELWWFLFENNGDFHFKDVADITKLRDYEFSWWAVFHDMNNDSLQDLIVAENYVDLAFHKYFPLPWRFLLQKGDQTFAAAWKKSGVENSHYWITPLISDFNNDWLQDLVWVNIAGSSYAYIQEKTNKNSYINISFPETAQYIWAAVTIILDDGTSLYDAYIIWEWLAADQSNTLHFWLWESKNIQEITVRLVDGLEISLPPKINTTYKMKDYE